MKKQTALIASLVILLLIVFSCKNKLDNIEIQKTNHKHDTVRSLVEFAFEFPDTVYINKLYYGKIKYKCILDTITTSFDDPRKLRYITFYMTKTRSIDYEDKQLYKVKLDTFGALDHNNIPFL